MSSGRSSTFLLLLFWAGAMALGLVLFQRGAPFGPPPAEAPATSPLPARSPEAPRLRPIPSLARSPAAPAASVRCERAGTRAERSVLDELDRARQNPAGYALRLQWLEGSYSGRDRRAAGGMLMSTQEGVGAVEEAVRELRALRPRGRLSWSPCLGQMAFDHARDTGPRGLIGHESSRGEGVAQRARRYAPGSSGVGENISYGPTAPRDIVEQLIIDDGVPSRGHRKNIFDPLFRSAGVACGPHARYGTLCVIDFSR